MEIFSPTFALLLVSLLFTGDRSISAATTRDVARAVVYGIVALIVLISMILIWIGG